MVRFNPRRVDRAHNNTPIMYDREIDDFAQTVLADYRPELLREPGRINFQHFLESYLGLCIDFQDIYSDDPDRPILALTAFQRGKIRVFDRENECVRKITVPERTVVIDNSVMEPGRESLALFSGLHEGGHVTMHWPVYTGESFDGCVYDPEDAFETYPDPIVCCRRENIESGAGAKRIQTPEGWREHQADYFAAAAAMPNATFLPFVNRLLRECGHYKHSVRTGIDGDLDILAEDILPDAISDVYGVSKRAARIKLRKTGFVISD